MWENQYKRSTCEKNPFIFLKNPFHLTRSIKLQKKSILFKRNKFYLTFFFVFYLTVHLEKWNKYRGLRNWLQW